MQFQMEIENPRKRGRALDFDDYEEEVHTAKKTRQCDMYAPTRNSSPSSGSASPASVAESQDYFSRHTKPQSTIISGWNQARRSEEELRRLFPWLFASQ